MVHSQEKAPWRASLVAKYIKHGLSTISGDKWFKLNVMLHVCNAWYKGNLMVTLIFPLRFLEEYAKYNLTFWALTTGNEPSAGRMTNYRSLLSWFYDWFHMKPYEQQTEKYLFLSAVSRLLVSPLRSKETGWRWTWVLPCMCRHTHTHTSSYWMTTACCCHTGPKWWVHGQSDSGRSRSKMYYTWGCTVVAENHQKIWTHKILLGHVDCS